MKETIAAFVLVWALTGMLMDVAKANERMPAIEDNIPIDYEHVGSEPEYIHGAHCIDGRTF